MCVCSSCFSSYHYVNVTFVKATLLGGHQSEWEAATEVCTIDEGQSLKGMVPILHSARASENHSVTSMPWNLCIAKYSAAKSLSLDSAVELRL